jgi:GAF domain-containing protein
MVAVESSRTRRKASLKPRKQAAPSPSVAEYEARIAALTAELREARDQQTATAEVLGVINSSPGDLAPVFDAMLEKATRLCGAAFAILWRFDGEFAKPEASYRVPAAWAEFWKDPKRPPAGSGPRLVMGGGGTQAVADMTQHAPYLSGEPMARAIVELAGARSLMITPLRKEDMTLGAITIYRQEVLPFSDKEIALLENFAAQAVIAMENARLITETREVLEQQTATAEVLGVINASPGDLTPVFDAMLERAMRLCEAAFGSLWTLGGDRFRPVAHFGLPPAYAEYLTQEVPPAGRGTGRARLLAGEPFAHIPDLSDEQPYRDGEPHRRALVDLGGARTALLVPLRKEATVVGFIMIYRQQVEPFTDKQVSLLQNFAAQAVIAMENARLITETRQRTAELQESLEYQTATSDVLKVISRSVFDLQPVLDTVLETAARLCGAEKAILYRYENDAYRFAAGYSNEPEYERLERATPIYPGEGTVAGRAALRKRAVQILDPLADPLYAAKEEARLGKARSMIGVPLLREGSPIGVIALARERVEPFTDRQIELVQRTRR